MNKTKPVLLVAAAAAALALGTCTNGVNLLDELTDDVMVAKQLYLAVQSQTPDSGAGDVIPDAKISITFDRPLDMTSVSAESVVITPSIGEADVDLGNSFSYNEVTNTLSIDHTTFFKTNTEYTVRLTNALRGADASALRQEVSWSFTAGEAPVGSVHIADAEFVNRNSPVTVYFSSNMIVDTIEISFESDMDPIYWTGTKTVSRSVALPAGDGEKWVYARFFDTHKSLSTPIMSDSITVDTIDPVVGAGPLKYINVYGGASMEGSATDERSGIKTIEWTTTGPSGTAFSSSAILTPVVTSPSAADGSSFTVTLTVTDNAGNSSASSATVTVDTTRPNAPTVTSAAAITLDTTPTWTWSSNGGGMSPITFRYNLDKGSWSADTTQTSWSPALSDGLHRVYVSERDEAGNWSSSDDYQVRVTPCIPYSGQTAVPRTTNIYWRSVIGATSYTLYSGTSTVGKMPSDEVYTIPFNPPVTLAANTTYYWYYIVHGGFSEGVRFPPTGYWSFTTGS